MRTVVAWRQQARSQSSFKACCLCSCWLYERGVAVATITVPVLKCSLQCRGSASCEVQLAVSTVVNCAVLKWHVTAVSTADAVSLLLPYTCLCRGKVFTKGKRGKGFH